MDIVADLVGVTLGPKGRNVVLQNKYGPPKIVNDGETVLKQVVCTFSLTSFALCFIHPIITMTYNLFLHKVEQLEQLKCVLVMHL